MPFAVFFAIYHFVIETIQGKNFDKGNLRLVLITMTSDFQQCAGICLMSAETDKISRGPVVFLISETTTFYKKL